MLVRPAIPEAAVATGLGISRGQHRAGAIQCSGSRWNCSGGGSCDSSLTVVALVACHSEGDKDRDYPPMRAQP